MVAGGEQRFAALVDADTAVRPGDQVRAGAEPGRIYLFDAGTQGAAGVV